MVAIAAAAVMLGQDFSSITVERIAGGYQFVDGLVWSRENFVIFADVPPRKLFRWVPGQGAEPFRDSAGAAGGNTFDAQGRLYSCESVARRVVRQDKKGKVEVLAERWEGKRLNAPNDLAVRHDGELYFTDPAYGNQQEARELDFYGVFHVTHKGVLELVSKSGGRPNGVALSPNGRILYVADSDGRKIRAWDLDKNGQASGERVLVHGIAGVPKGLRTDETGNLYLAAKALEVYSPEGKPLATIQIPETPTNLAFGDPDLQTLFIAARTSVYRIRLHVKGSLQY